MLKLLSLSVVAVVALLFSGGAVLAQVCDPDIDCVPAVSIPEPGILAIMVTGLGVLAIARFRKRK